ncbi:MAG: hypothetical protein NT062_17435 [Proteobacteria bacterium]|nr:hypothetical protein [Pseudomonadota bacterium]
MGRGVRGDLAGRSPALHRPGARHRRDARRARPPVAAPFGAAAPVAPCPDATIDDATIASSLLGDPRTVAVGALPTPAHVAAIERRIPATIRDAVRGGAWRAGPALPLDVHAPARLIATPAWDGICALVDASARRPPPAPPSLAALETALRRLDARARAGAPHARADRRLGWVVLAGVVVANGLLVAILLRDPPTATTTIVRLPVPMPVPGPREPTLVHEPR